MERIPSPKDVFNDSYMIGQIQRKFSAAIFPQNLTKGYQPAPTSIVCLFLFQQQVVGVRLRRRNINLSYRLLTKPISMVRFCLAGLNGEHSSRIGDGNVARAD